MATGHAADSHSSRSRRARGRGHRRQTAEAASPATGQDVWAELGQGGGVAILGPAGKQRQGKVGVGKGNHVAASG
jgi:hypothetical protein